MSIVKWVGAILLAFLGGAGGAIYTDAKAYFFPPLEPVTVPARVEQGALPAPLPSKAPTTSSDLPSTAAPPIEKRAPVADAE